MASSKTSYESTFFVQPLFSEGVLEKLSKLGRSNSNMYNFRPKKPISARYPIFERITQFSTWQLCLVLFQSRGKLGFPDWVA